MDIKEILEYNKKCAEFLGFEKPIFMGGAIEDDSMVSNIKGSYGHYKIEEMKFHSDWNWIHEIYEKINNSKITVEKNGVPNSIGPYINMVRPIITFLINNDKEEVIKHINNFINWYNQNKK